MIEQRKTQPNHEEMCKFFECDELIRIPLNSFQNRLKLKHRISLLLGDYFNNIFSNKADYKEFTFKELLDELYCEEFKKEINSSTLKKALKELHRFRMFIIFEFKNRYFCFPALKTNYQAYAYLLKIDKDNLSIDNMVKMFDVDRD